MRSDPDVQLKDGDMVKIDIGAHIDGFIATAAHTLIVGASKDNKVRIYGNCFQRLAGFVRYLCEPKAKSVLETTVALNGVLTLQSWIQWDSRGAVTGPWLQASLVV